MGVFEMDIFGRRSRPRDHPVASHLLPAAVLLLLIGVSAPLTRGGEAASSPGNVAAPAPAGMQPTRWVAADGVDAGDCSSATAACRTIAYAIAHSVAWDKIEVSEGTFLESVTIPFPLYIWGQGASKTFLRGSDPCDPAHLPAVITIDTVGYQGLPDAPRVPQVYLIDMAIGCAGEGIRVVEEGEEISERLVFDETLTVGVRLDAGEDVYTKAVQSVFRGEVGVQAARGTRVYASSSTFRTQEVAVRADGPLADLGLLANRIVGNRVAGVDAGGTDASVARYDGNWWGCNAGPGQAGCDKVIGPPVGWWLTLALTAPASVRAGDSVAVSVSMRHSDGTAGSQSFPLGDVEFSTRGGGTISGVSVTPDGPATANIAAPSTPGTVEVAARLDNETVSTKIEVVAAATASPERPTATLPASISGGTLPPTDLAPLAAPSTGPHPLPGALMCLLTLAAIASLAAIQMPAARRQAPRQRNRLS